MKLAAYLSTASISVLLASGCGSGDGSSFAADSGSDGGTCPSVSACGGTIMPGTYTITSFCGHSDPEPYTPICQNATLSIVTADAQGTYTFSADGSYSNSLTVTPHAVLAVPASCMGPPGLQTCSDLEQALQTNSGSGSATSATVVCSGTSGCTCTLVATESVAVAGSYSALGDTLTFQPDNGSSPIEDPYCVSGNQITVALVPSNGESVSQGTMVLTRQ